MGGNIVLNLVKMALIGVVAILLAIQLWQNDAVEERVAGLQTSVADTQDKLRETMRTAERQQTRLDQVLAAVEDTRRRLAQGVVVANGGGTGESDPLPPDTSATDPRTLPYWPTDDNVLIDLDGEPRPPDDAPEGGTLYYYTRSNPPSLNIHVQSEAELQERIVGPIVEYLAPQSRADPDKYVPGVCNRIAVNDDFTEFTCYIRKGTYWHPPYLTDEEKTGHLKWLADLPRQEVTAADVKFSFEIVRDPLSECAALRSYLDKDFESIEVIDDYTVKIKWKRSLYYNMGSTLSLIRIYPKFIYTRDERGEPIPEDLIAPTYPKHWFNNKLLGTGPWIFDGFVSNQYIKMRRNDDYWAPYKPKLDAVYLHIQAQPEILINMFKSGKLDVYYLGMDQYRAEWLEGKGNPGSIREGVERGEYSFHPWRVFAYYYVGWNLRKPQLQDRAVRRALAHLYPLERVLKDVHYGLAIPCIGPVHPFESSFVEDLERFPFDPDEAARQLDAAGWKMGDQGVREKLVDGAVRQLRIKMLFPSASPAAKSQVLLYQKAAAEAGVLIEPQQREWQAMLKLLEDKEYDACVLGWANSWDSDPSQIWHSDSARAARGSNSGSYMSDEVDAIIEKLKTEFDPDERKELWRRFQTTIVGDQPYRFTIITERPWVINNKLANHYFAKLRPQDWFLPWHLAEPEKK